MVKHAQTIRRNRSTNCLSVFDHFVELALKTEVNIKSTTNIGEVELSQLVCLYVCLYLNWYVYLNTPDVCDSCFYLSYVVPGANQTQSAFTFSNSTMKTPEQYVNPV